MKTFFLTVLHGKKKFSEEHFFTRIFSCVEIFPYSSLLPWEDMDAVTLMKKKNNLINIYLTLPLRASVDSSCLSVTH